MEKESINTSDVLSMSMPKSVETKKAEPVATYHDEEKAPVPVPGPQEPAMLKTPPAAPMGREPQGPDVHEEDEMKYSLTKDFISRLESIEATNKSIAALLEKLLKAADEDEEETVKANYASKPKPKDSDYPTPPTDGPTSDGLQAPKVTQMINPHSKPFGKDIVKAALGGAADGSRETPTMGSERTVALEEVLKGKRKVSGISRQLRGL